ncbi:winged helix-turn-helix transcriptional regulator [Sphingomonas yantingensis]|uniref:DNA-binding HxlR family transcriptional regulator n=1 Tax=Sphingomonas yantingensis TaxID=1241761 RepID=A0A7W9ARB1_9SPHN|nr:helix-turn-helix domain-containing protein [Sphingomonas yantingensis]MBB5699167.1 DNA-binding HxlR family transcriptional regulator [Sphingomonas yantingensis]
MELTTPEPIHTECKRFSGVLGLIGDKWTVMIVMTLTERPRRFNDIKRTIGGISQQMLARTLRALERDGMVTRTVYPTVPPQVEYDLTALGRSLAGPIRELGYWANAHISEIENNRSAFDAARDG